MMKTRMHIAIVATDVTWLSSMSGPSRESIAGELSERFSRVEVVMANDRGGLARLAAKKPDLAFVGAKAVPTHAPAGTARIRLVWVSDYLEKRGIPCTGSPSAAHRLDLDKPSAKRRVRAAGLATAPFRVIKEKASQPGRLPAGARYPVFVKPTNRGGSTGIDCGSVVYDAEALWRKHLDIAKTLHTDTLVEEFLPGREFSVAVLRDIEDGSYGAYPLEMIALPDGNGNRFLTRGTKSANLETVRKVDDVKLYEAVGAFALASFRAVGGRDYGRVDVRLDAQGNPHFLEANLIPSLIDGYGSFPKSCRLNLGIDYRTMLTRIVQLGLLRPPLGSFGHMGGSDNVGLEPSLAGAVL